MSRGRILCAVTEDDAARDVVDTGTAIAEAAGLEAVFACIAHVDVAPSATVVPAGPGIGWAPFPQGSFHAAERRAAERAEAFLDALGLDDADTRIRIGSPATEIHDLARELEADAIVVGGAPGGALKALAVGSVTRWLAVNGSFPVVFARSASQLEMSGPVLCGIDPAAHAASRVAAVAAHFADLLGTHMSLVHAEWSADGEERSAPDAARVGLQHIADGLRVPVPVDVEVVEGDETDGLARHAVRRGASLLVVGNRGRGPIRSSLMGSTSLKLAQHARSPVVVVPPDATT